MLLLIGSALCLAFSNVVAIEPIPVSEIEADMHAVDTAIGAPWVEMNRSGVRRAETKRESFSLTDAQKALFNRHWEMETVQPERPAPPEQFNLAMLADALDVVVEMDMEGRKVLLRMDKLEEWANLEEDLKQMERKERREEKLVDKAMDEMKNNRTGLAEEVVEQIAVGKEKPAQLTNLVGSGSEEPGQEEEDANEPQCSEQDKPAFLKEREEEQATESEAKNTTSIMATLKIPTLEELEEQKAKMEEKAAEVPSAEPVMVISVQQGGTARRGFWPEFMARFGSQEREEEAELKFVEAAHRKKEEEEEKRLTNITPADQAGVMFVVEEEENAPEERKSSENDELKKEEEEKRQEEENARVERELRKQAEKEAESSEENNEKRIFQQIQVQREASETEQKNPSGSIVVVDWAEPDASDSSEEEKKKEEEEEKKNDDGSSGGLLGVLSRVLLGRTKREVPVEGPVPKEQNGADEKKQKKEGQKDDENTKGKKLVMMRSFEGRMALGQKGQLGFSTKLMMTMDVPKKGEEKQQREEEEDQDEEEIKQAIESDEEKGANREVVVTDEEKQLLPAKAEAAKVEENNLAMKKAQAAPQANDEVREIVLLNADGTKVHGKWMVETEQQQTPQANGGKTGSQEASPQQLANHRSSAELASMMEEMKAEKQDMKRYLEEYLARTEGPNKPKRNEKLAYIWYSELQYWIAKRIEADFGEFETDGGSKVGEVLDQATGMPASMRKDELGYLSTKWGKTIGRLALLSDWIGKEFKRRRK